MPPSKSAKENPKKTKGEHRITVSCADVEALIFGTRHDPEKAFGRKKNRVRRGVPDAEEWKSVDMEDKDDALESMSTPLIRQEPPCKLYHCADTSTHSEAIPVDFAETRSISSESESDPTANEHTDMISLRVRLPQSQSEVNGSIGGEKGWAEKIEESPEMLQKRREGQKRADERELVRCVARRLCAFGVVVNASHGGTDWLGKDKGVKGKGKGKRKVGRAEDDDSDEGREESRRKCEAVMSGQVVEASYAKGEWGIRWRE